IVPAATTATATTIAPAAAAGVIVAAAVRFVDGGNAGRDDLAEQRLVLKRVEIAGHGIAALGLPTLDHGTGAVVELAGGLDLEAEAGQAALHVAALVAVEADLVFGGLVGFPGEGFGVDGGGKVTGRAGLPGIPELGDAAERQRLERAVRVAGEIGVK